MSKPSAKPSEAAPRPVRVLDLDGGLWSVPPGTLLWTQLHRDAALGHGEHAVHIMALRQEDGRGDVFTGPTDAALSVLPEGSERAWRQAMLLRLRERVRRGDS